MSRMSIGELAKRAGITTSTIRYYESLGLLPAAERVGGKRRFGPEALLRLNAIKLFKQAGFTVAELQVLLQSEPLPDQAELSGLLDRKARELDQLLEKVHVMKEILAVIRRCGCLTLEECADLLGKEA